MSDPRVSTAVGLFPSLGKVDELVAPQGATLLACAGFEDRAKASAVAVKGAENGVLLAYRPIDRRNQLEALRDAFRKNVRLGDRDVLEYDRYAPNEFPSELRSTLERLRTRRLIVDVSAMSKLTIMLSLDVAREMNLPVTVFYAEAAEYGPSAAQYNMARESGLFQPTISVYTGVHGVVRASRFCSVAMQGQPVATIAFMSFNDQLIQTLINTVYPSRLFLINGSPPVHRWREEATAWIHERLREEWPREDNPIAEDGLPIRRASTLDYRDALGQLLDLYWTLSVDHRMVLAPTGSKMQTIACYLLKCLQPDVHIEYPTPKGFLDLYSTGIGRMWSVEFSRLGEFIERTQMECRRQWLSIAGVERT